jgi:hypothetical protein
MGATRRHISTATVPSRRIGRQSTSYTRKKMHARATRSLRRSRLGRATGLQVRLTNCPEKDSMACTRKLAQGIERRQDSHLAFISHLDQDFKERECACLSVFRLCLCFLIPCSQVARQYSNFASLLGLLRTVREMTVKKRQTFGWYF